MELPLGNWENKNNSKIYKVVRCLNVQRVPIRELQMRSVFPNVSHAFEMIFIWNVRLRTH